MTKMKKLRQTEDRPVYPEQIDAMARYLHDRNGQGCPTTWEQQDDGTRRMYKGQVIAMLLEADFYVEGA